MKTITFLNEKGGVGKTTLANTVGAGLAIRGYKVVLVDADPQGNLTAGLGLDLAPGFYDLLVRDREFSEVLRLISPEVYEVPGEPVKGQLYMVPGNKETRTIAQNVDSALVIRDRFKELQDSVDVVIFDTSPTPSLLHASIYLATDAIIFPTELEYYSFHGLIQSIDHRSNYNRDRVQLTGQPIEILGIIPNKFRASTLEHQENFESLRERFGRLVWDPLPLRIVWGEAPMRKRAIFNYAPETAAAREAWGVIDRVIGALEHV